VEQAINLGAWKFPYTDLCGEAINLGAWKFPYTDLGGASHKFGCMEISIL
jgi:hypothetical protein